ncbi:hypothetical protein BDV12DRAFT_196179 [Aspergillus spectabilis]
MSRKTATRSIAFLLVALFTLLCIYQGVLSTHKADLTSYDKRSATRDVTISPRQVLDEGSTQTTADLPDIIVKYAEKGAGLMCQLRDVDPNGHLQSDITDDQFNEMYSSQPYAGTKTKTGEGIPEAMERLGLPLEKGVKGTKGFAYYQDREYMDGDELQGGTFAYYIGSASPQAGYISAEDNANAMYQAGVPGPEPRRLSDIYYLIWKQIAKISKELRNIKYFIRFHVINTQSKTVALKACDNDVPFWPGKDFDMSTTEGKALLGSPNGSGVAYFLINHKQDLGVKVVKKVTVFKTIGTNAETGLPEDWIHFVFSIGADSKKKGKK